VCILVVDDDLDASYTCCYLSFVVSISNWLLYLPSVIFCIAASFYHLFFSQQLIVLIVIYIVQASTDAGNLSGWMTTRV